MRVRYILAILLLIASGASAAESPFIYGIHDTDPAPTEWLNHVKQGTVTGGWLTSTVAVGHNPGDQSGVNFTGFSNQGHTVVCRINNGYSDVGTIPLRAYYADFAQRCANFVQNSPGCEIWVIGNETNLAVEWPPDGGNKPYVSPQDYANCFRLVYNAIKAVRPSHKVVSQALGPFGGPYGPGVFDQWTHDGCPLNWVDYLNQMLTAIKTSGGIDGMALHINSRGYTYNDIHSNWKVNAGGRDLYFSFYVYKDWIDYGIPSDLYHLPLYATECNGVYYWKGGHPENGASHYEPGWMQEIFAEINRYNQTAVTSGKPVFRCVNMYRWCNGCDGWNIDGSAYKGQILSDLDAAVAQAYRWPEPPPVPGTISGYARTRGGQIMTNTQIVTSTGGYSAMTNGSGYYTIPDVAPGTYQMTASKLSYCYQTISGVNVASGGSTTQDFVLTRIGDNMLTNGNFEGGFQGSGVATGWKSWTSGWSIRSPSPTPRPPSTPGATLSSGAGRTACAYMAGYVRPPVGSLPGVSTSSTDGSASSRPMRVRGPRSDTISPARPRTARRRASSTPSSKAAGRMPGCTTTRPSPPPQAASPSSSSSGSTTRAASGRVGPMRMTPR